MATERKLPRVAITYCTQCKWMLRAGYFGQELLSTFGTALGEVALQPATGGVFRVELTHIPANVTSAPADASTQPQTTLLWDRKAEGGFPETKLLKQRVRDQLEPARDLGHSDVGGKKGKDERVAAREAAAAAAAAEVAKKEGGSEEECGWECL
ncbi:uncharacterized protein K452DRAFT_24042 [Aplosporella prunicola CBS 121167]|uniref:Selenoprotein W-like protein n=1 Tax=Aplosporella prunicola CBS 121167 TaxID=1176127 RepID=A0A6A6BF80_9PEZI|nr:uncharacterized protein K452DRAFT_24042 [Aplosporella prunicola CBS 121167]KAF2141965.1 hypothetical protein K452DRAFT_24042 [Aplosporella prunicola CBS 121167]